MRPLVSALLLTALTLSLAACGREETRTLDVGPPAPTPVEPAAPEPAAGDQPAGAVAPDSRTPSAEPAAEEPAAPEKPEGKFASYMTQIPYVVGADKGLAIAAKTGKPIMLFYTATW